MTSHHLNGTQGCGRKEHRPFGWAWSPCVCAAARWRDGDMELTDVGHKRLDSRAGRESSAEICLVMYQRLTRWRRVVLEGDGKSFPREVLPHHYLLMVLILNGMPYFHNSLDNAHCVLVVLELVSYTIEASSYYCVYQMKSIACIRTKTKSHKAQKGMHVRGIKHTSQ